MSAEMSDQRNVCYLDGPKVAKGRALPVDGIGWAIGGGA